MAPQVLQIHWSFGSEMIPIDGKITKGQIIRTTEHWKTSEGTSVVSYVVEVKEFTRKHGKNMLRLIYDKERQFHKKVLNPSNEVGWGETVIKWDSAGESGTAQWIDKNVNSPLNGTVRVSIFGGKKAIATLRKTASVIVKLRPDQQRLRQLLLTVDQSCALSKEKEQGTLDVAHIVPVKNGGQEVIENAILLRADLHRLWDAGLIWFDQSRAEAILKCSPKLSARYKKHLEGKLLPIELLKRVESALRARSQLPGGRGLAE